MRNKEPKTTPLKSIRRYCLWCSNGQMKEIKKCSKTDCLFYPFRMRRKTKKGSLLKVIRKRCLDCGEGTAQSVRICRFTDCPIFAYRSGRSEAHRLVWVDRTRSTPFTKKHGASCTKNSKNEPLNIKQ